jgi:glc operon protein GlcG
MLSSTLLFSLALTFSLIPAPPAENRPSPPQTGTVAVCSAVSKPEIEAVIGHLLDAAGEEHGKFESTCNYSAGDVAVTISIRYLTQAFDLQSETRNLQAAFPDLKLREMTGLGARAFALEIPGAGVQLHVLPDENQYLMVSVLGVGGGGTDAAAQIARAALRRFRPKRPAVYWPGRMLTLHVAQQLAARSQLEAVAISCPMSIAIVDAGANLILHQRMDGALLGSAAACYKKARSAALYKRPTKVFEDVLAGGRMAILSLPDVMPIEGGIPLLREGVLVGAIGVSGGTAQQDGVVATAVAELFASLGSKS